MTRSPGATLAAIDAAMTAACSIGTLEVVAMGSKMGLTLECMADVLTKGAARNAATDLLLAPLAAGKRPQAAALRRLLLDLDGVIRPAAELCSPMPLTSAARAAVQLAAHLGPQDADTICFAERGAGIRFAAAGHTAQRAPSATPNTGNLKIGYVGLGAMGGALARRLMQSRKLHVFDARAESMRSCEIDGATGMRDLPSLARECDVIIVCLPTSAVVRQVLFGAGGLAEGLAPGKIVIDQTSGDPTLTRQFAAELGTRGVALIDAPVSGGPGGAKAGTIAIMCGGETQAFATARDVLQDISPNLVDCGQVGNGHVAKSVNNAIAAMCRLLTYEGAALALKSGHALDALGATLDAGSGWSVSSRRNLPALASGGSTSNFQIGLMLKDVRLACGMGMDCGAPMSVVSAVRAIYECATNQLGATTNSDEIAGLYEKMTGVAFRNIA